MGERSVKLELAEGLELGGAHSERRDLIGFAAAAGGREPRVAPFAAIFPQIHPPGQLRTGDGRRFLPQNAEFTSIPDFAAGVG